MSEKYFQIMIDNDFETVYEETTLEEAIDVVYTESELNEIRRVGSGVCTTDNYVSRSYGENWDGKKYLTPPNFTITKGPVIIKFVKRLLEKDKSVSIDVSERSLSVLSNSNHAFHEIGLHFRPSRNDFIKYKEPKVKAISIQKSDQLFVRKLVCRIIEKFLYDQVSFEVVFKYVDTIDKQEQCVKLGNSIGINLKKIKEFVPIKGSYYNGYWVKEEQVISNVFGRYVKDRTKISTDESKLIKMLEQYLNEWYNSIK